MSRHYPNTPLESWRNITGIGQGGAWADGERYDYPYPHPPSSRRSSTATATSYAPASGSRRTSVSSYYAAADSEGGYTEAEIGMGRGGRERLGKAG